MIMNLLRENETLRELILGTWLFGIIVGILLTIFFPPALYRAIGLLIGLLAASFMAIHMAYCIELTVQLDEKGANSYVRKMTVIRYVLVCVLLVVTALTRIGDPISFCIGTLGLKIGAYSQPLVHRVLNKFKNNNNDKGGE